MTHQERELKYHNLRIAEPHEAGWFFTHEKLNGEIVKLWVTEIEEND